MKITMIKKRLTNGNFCDKCIEMEELLKKRALIQHIDDIIIAEEDDPASPGMEMARKHGVKSAPFYVVSDNGEKERVYTSTLELIREKLTGRRVDKVCDEREEEELDIQNLLSCLPVDDPYKIIDYALRQFGTDCAIAFSGAEDVVLIDMAARTGLPFSVFCLDTGRLHSETYRFLDTVRHHYEIDLRIMTPDPELLEPFVDKKGLFSFYRDGHKECCGIRKVGPLKRALTDYRSWITGQRKDQSPSTRGFVPIAQIDGAFTGKDGRPLYKFNPLSNWTLDMVWMYIRENKVPYNELHDRGFVSIGCEPCTRTVRPGEHERAGRWWWEEETKRECGLHIPRNC